MSLLTVERNSPSPYDSVSHTLSQWFFIKPVLFKKKKKKKKDLSGYHVGDAMFGNRGRLPWNI